MRDYVIPLVRGDVRSTQLKPWRRRRPRWTPLTADYIRIATERLC